MSAYSDWKCGALTDEEYEMDSRRECEDHYSYEYEYEEEEGEE